MITHYFIYQNTLFRLKIYHFAIFFQNIVVYSRILIYTKFIAIGITITYHKDSFKLA